MKNFLKAALIFAVTVLIFRAIGPGSAILFLLVAMVIA